MVRFNQYTARVIVAGFLAFFLVVGTGSIAHALPVTAWGTPVASVGSTATVGSYNTATHNISFYIPLNSTHNGVYGVANSSGYVSGTTSDTQTGPFDNPGALTMYLRYTPLASPVPSELSSAVLTFNFIDLDLAGGNDPTGFFESVRFYNGSGTALSPLITSLSGSTSTYTVTGNYTSQTITFSDVTSYITGDPFYAQLVFGSRMTQSGTWRNTVESLSTSLVTTRAPAQVPEPSSMLLSALGFGALAIWNRRSRRSPA